LSPPGRTLECITEEDNRAIIPSIMNEEKVTDSELKREILYG